MRMTTDMSAVCAIADADVWMNGGYFVFRNEIFDHMEDGEELVCEPFQRLIDRQRLCAYKYEGFWGCMDTYKEKQRLDDMHVRGITPWEVWKNAPLVESDRPASPAAGRRLALLRSVS